MENRNYYLISSLFIISILCSGLEYQKRYVPLNEIQNTLEKTLPENIIYTKVPRGLILSIDGDFFFDSCETRLKESALQTLDIISDIIKDINNDFVIEDHSSVSDCVLNLENWEISSMRSSAIADYFINKKDIPKEQIFDIGYAEFMPLKTEIASKIENLKNRIDFVIIDFEAKR